MHVKKTGFIGLGLIGGSIAKAIRQYHPDCEYRKGSSIPPAPPLMTIFGTAIISSCAPRSLATQPI